MNTASTATQDNYLLHERAYQAHRKLYDDLHKHMKTLKKPLKAVTGRQVFVRDGTAMRAAQSISADFRTNPQHDYGGALPVTLGELNAEIRTLQEGWLHETAPIRNFTPGNSVANKLGHKKKSPMDTLDRAILRNAKDRKRYANRYKADAVWSNDLAHGSDHVNEAYRATLGGIKWEEYKDTDRRLTVGTINCNGLTAGKLDMLLLLMKYEGIDVLNCVDTHVNSNQGKWLARRARHQLGPGTRCHNSPYMSTVEMENWEKLKLPTIGEKDG
jgi:hypothetical protein